MENYCNISMSSFIFKTKVKNSLGCIGESKVERIFILDFQLPFFFCFSSRISFLWHRLMAPNTEWTRIPRACAPCCRGPRNNRNGVNQCPRKVSRASAGPPTGTSDEPAVTGKLRSSFGLKPSARKFSNRSPIAFAEPSSCRGLIPHDARTQPDTEHCCPSSIS
eukprot:04812_6